MNKICRECGKELTLKLENVGIKEIADMVGDALNGICNDKRMIGFNTSEDAKRMIRNSYTKIETSDATIYNTVYDILPSDRERIADFIEQQAEQIKAMREIFQDVLSDCYLSDGMRSEIIKRLDGGSK